MTLPFEITTTNIWIAIGFIGQGMFFMRFFVQWLASEKERKSVIPQSFWYYSILGSLILLAYAIWRKDPVIILGQSTGFIIYFRNLYLINRNSKDSVTSTEPSNS
jgi:lipid-A-disaccharide synthase-like uncharacterized protein